MTFEIQLNLFKLVYEIVFSPYTHIPRGEYLAISMNHLKS